MAVLEQLLARPGVGRRECIALSITMPAHIGVAVKDDDQASKIYTGSLPLKAAGKDEVG